VKRPTQGLTGEGAFRELRRIMSEIREAVGKIKNRPLRPELRGEAEP
jgi:hypothetical protein